MNTSLRPPLIWIAWLTIVLTGVALFGLVLVFAPGVAREGFSLLIYSDAGHISSFGLEPVRYIGLAHAVLGSVMFGWGVCLIIVVRGELARGSWLGWQIVSGSVAAWFIPDTAFSLWSGFWQNAVLNLGIVVLFSIPLIATYKVCRGSATR